MDFRVMLHYYLREIKLDQILKTGSYFSRSNYRVISRRIKLLAVARAIEFFGGVLVIDWRDR